MSELTFAHTGHTVDTRKGIKTVTAVYAAHRNPSLTSLEDQARVSFIMNMPRLSLHPDGKSIIRRICDGGLRQETVAYLRNPSRSLANNIGYTALAIANMIESDIETGEHGDIIDAYLREPFRNVQMLELMFENPGRLDDNDYFLERIA